MKADFLILEDWWQKNQGLCNGYRCYMPFCFFSINVRLLFINFSFLFFLYKIVNIIAIRIVKPLKYLLSYRPKQNCQLEINSKISSLRCVSKLEPINYNSILHKANEKKQLPKTAKTWLTLSRRTDCLPYSNSRIKRTPTPAFSASCRWLIFCCFLLSLIKFECGDFIFFL